MQFVKAACTFQPKQGCMATGQTRHVRGGLMSIDNTQSSNTAGVTFNQALDRFMTERPGGIAESSAEAYKYGIQQFGEWMEANGHNFNQLTPLEVGGFWPYLRDERDLSEATHESYTKAVRKFLEFCEEYEIVQEGLHKHVENITATGQARQWDQEIDVDRIDEIVEVLETAYGPTRNPLIFRVLAATGLRKSGLLAIDVGDVYTRDGFPVIDVKNREETKLKGRDKHERIINISMDLFRDIQTYVQNHRTDVKDEHGRNPLFTTANGRVADSTVRDTVMYYTCPEITGAGECSCVNPNKHETRDCEKSFRPHALRGYHVTKLRNDGVGFESIGERVGATAETLRQHYDRSTKEQRSERRRENLANLL